jgi:hypothetical protein
MRPLHAVLIAAPLLLWLVNSAFASELRPRLINQILASLARRIFDSRPACSCRQWSRLQWRPQHR